MAGCAGLAKRHHLMTVSVCDELDLGIGSHHSGDTSRMDQRPYIIELEGVPAMPEAQRLEIVQFVFNELDAIYAGPWPVAMAMLAFMDEKAFAGLPWDKAWQVIELRVLDAFELPESAALAFDLDYQVLEAAGAKGLKR